MNINAFILDEDASEEGLFLQKYRRKLFELVSDGHLNVLQYSYFKKFDEMKGTLANISWYIDTIKELEEDVKQDENNKSKSLSEFKDLSAKAFKKFFVNKKKDGFRISKNIAFNATRLETIDLTDEQKRAVKKLVNFICDRSKKTYGLYGYAGTGKTTTVVEFVSYMIRNRYLNTIAFTAPTNKAVNVIKSKFKPHLRKIIEDMFEKKLDDNFNFDDAMDFLEDHGIRISFITIHKLLNFQTDFSVTGDTIFVRDVKKGSIIPDYELCIIDECSMIAMDMIDNIFSEIRSITQKKGNNFKKSPKIIFTGDPAQLPPVNEENSSIFAKNESDLSFGDYMKIMNYNITQCVTSDAEDMMKQHYDTLLEDLLRMESFLLKTVVRSKIDNVTKICNEIRNWVKQTNGLPQLKEFVGLEGVHFFPYIQASNKTKTEWFSKFLECTKSGVSTIILTWTNRQTDMYNDTIRRLIFKKKDLKKYEKNDILMLGDFYNLDLGEELVKQKLYTSEQIKVVETNLKEVPINCFEVFTSSSLKRVKNYAKIEDKLKMLVFGLNKQYCKNTKFLCWILKVHKLGEESSDTMTIVTVDDNDLERYNKIKEDTSNIIKNFSRQMINAYKSGPKQIERYLIKPLWKQWHKIFQEPFANINYGYSITCHKAQGSNFYDVFVDINDVLLNKRMKEAKKCVYTAVTRTSNELYMLI